MTHPLFFGYGSLVNLATHDYAAPRPARLSGWRRVWRHTALRPVAFLSVERHAESVIEGVVAGVPDGDWAALDAREAAYARRDITDAVAHDGPAAPTAVYEVEAGTAPTALHPILLSYLDVVIQGYDQMFGPMGVARFVQTTQGWEAPILDDRAAPQYPRAQRLTDDQTRMVDALLADLGARVL